MSKTSRPDVKMVRVKIPKERTETRTHQFVSVNDENFLVKIGEWVEVPYYVAEVLEKSEKRMQAAEAYMTMVSEASKK